MGVKSGRYAILCASDPSAALDVWYASDERGSNVGVYRRVDNSESQTAFVSVSGDYAQVVWPLSGKVLDVHGGVAAAGANVATWDNTGADASWWRLAETGDMVSVDGIQRASYFLASKLDEGLCATASGTADMSDVTLAARTGAALQKWVLVPLAGILSDGTYRICTALDGDVCVDVAGRSRANGANLGLWSCVDDANTQIFRVETLSDGSQALRCVDTGKAVDVESDDGAIRARSNAVMWDRGDAGTHQHWLATPDGTVRRNRCLVPAYQLVNQAASGLCLDCANGSTRLGTNVQVFEQNGRDAQRFEMRPEDAYDRSLPVPTGIVGDVSGRRSRLLAASGSVGVALCFDCPGAEAFQVRYRTRSRRPGGSVGAWSAWLSAADSSSSRDGWGEAWRPTAGVTGSGGTWSTLRAVRADLSTYDLVEIEAQVRAYEPEYGETASPAHGGSATGRVVIAKDYEVSVSGTVAWGPGGVTVPLASTLPGAGNRVGARVLDAVTLQEVCSWAYESGQGARCSVSFGPDKVLRVPEDGSDVLVDVDWTSRDGIRRAATLRAKVGWSSGSGMALAPKVTRADGDVLVVDMGGHAETALWVVTGLQSTPMPPGGDGTFTVPVPLGVPVRLFGCARDSDVLWGTWSKPLDPLARCAYVFNFERVGGVTWAALDVGVGDRPRLRASSSPDFSSSQRAGGGFDVVRFGGARSQSGEVSGSIVCDDGGDAETRIQALELARFAWMRDPFGHLARVAVTGVSFARDHVGWADVTVSFRRVDA